MHATYPTYLILMDLIMQIMKRLIMQFSPSCHQFLSPPSKYSPLLYEESKVLLAVAMKFTVWGSPHSDHEHVCQEFSHDTMCCGRSPYKALWSEVLLDYKTSHPKNNIN